MRPILAPPFERALLQPVPRLPASVLRLASDERLVALARSGSEPAFAAIFERHHRPLLAFCRHMLGSAEEADDAVQHTFLAAYRSLMASRRPIDLRPWLFSIARNRCLSVLGAARARSGAVPPEIATEHLSAEVQRRQDLRDLLADLSRLPDEQREALVLSEVGALTHAQVAEVIGVRREKVKALVFQARASLIASRDARETPCEEIREAIATERARALRRSNIRRHVRDCAGCKAFGEAVARQRRMLAAALPVVPSLALKSAVLGGVAGGGAAAAGGAGATVTAAKAIVAVAIASGGTAAGVEIAQRQDRAPSPPAAAAEAAPAKARSVAHRRPRATGSPAPALPGAERRTTRERREAARPRNRGVRRRAGAVDARGLERRGPEGKPEKRANRKRPGRGGPSVGRRPAGKRPGRREPSGRGRPVREPRAHVRERRGREQEAGLDASAPKGPKPRSTDGQRPAASATPVPVEPTPPPSDAGDGKGQQAAQGAPPAVPHERRRSG